MLTSKPLLHQTPLRSAHQLIQKLHDEHAVQLSTLREAHLQELAAVHARLDESASALDAAREQIVSIGDEKRSLVQAVEELRAVAGVHADPAAINTHPLLARLHHSALCYMCR